MQDSLHSCFQTIKRLYPVSEVHIKVHPILLLLAPVLRKCVLQHSVHWYLFQVSDYTPRLVLVLPFCDCLYFHIMPSRRLITKQCSPEEREVLPDYESQDSETADVMGLRRGHLLTLNVIAGKQKGFLIGILMPSIWHAFKKKIVCALLLVTVKNQPPSNQSLEEGQQWFVSGHSACQRCLTYAHIMALVLWVNSHYYLVCLKGGARRGSDRPF